MLSKKTLIIKSLCLQEIDWIRFLKVANSHALVLIQATGTEHDFVTI